LGRLGLLLSVFISLLVCNIQGQSYTIHLIQSDSVVYQFKDSLIDLKKNKSAEAEIKSILDDLIEKDYLAASIDTVIRDTIARRYNTFVHVGQKYDFSQISFDSLSLAYLRQLKIKAPVIKSQTTMQIMAILLPR